MVAHEDGFILQGGIGGNLGQGKSVTKQVYEDLAEVLENLCTFIAGIIEYFKTCMRLLG